MINQSKMNYKQMDNGTYQIAQEMLNIINKARNKITSMEKIQVEDLEDYIQTLKNIISKENLITNQPQKRRPVRPKTNSSYPQQPKISAYFAKAN